MYIIRWEYQVKPEFAAAFERIYAANGAWMELFTKGGGYLGTELLRDSNNPVRYITIDRWDSSRAYDSFFTRWKQAYHALDLRCKELTERESLLGMFTPF